MWRWVRQSLPKFILRSLRWWSQLSSRRLQHSIQPGRRDNCTVFSATDPKRSARDSHVPVLAPLLIGFAVFMVHLATIPITGTGINPARSFGAAVIFNESKPWDDHV
ncbi:unnamed protein product [Brassica rapa]|uniref:Aquaporin n=2 Tax=Brassica TaxID=3705 RepID=A0A3P6BGI6_BRACM|nr:unnamed protein product [Brassica napus]CAG7900698.1 unnamed protein product [Brassica rapa]CDY38151.1 BnaA07g02320D [Brassica napus]VDC95581.1 unnamed protein product [Brassica rapa]